MARSTVNRRSGAMLLPNVLLLLCFAMLAQAESPWGKSAVFMKGKWVPFDENDEAGVPQPYPPKTESWKKDDTTIMVSISSYRDHRCGRTLYNLFTYVFISFLIPWNCMCRLISHRALTTCFLYTTQQGQKP